GDDDYDADVDGDDSLADGSGGDCDDHDATVSSLLAETWYNGVDNDCAGGSDYDADVDGDDSLADGSGGDCDDHDATRSSLLTEVAGATGNDDDCDEYIDEDFINQGDLIFSEIMIDGVGSSEEEWFELYNTSSSTIYLDGWEMFDEMGSGTNSVFVSPDAGLSIAPSDYLVLCFSNTYLGSLCDYVYASNSYADSIYGTSANGSFKLANSGGTISVFLDDGTSSTPGLVDDITVAAGTFPITEGYSAELGYDVLDDTSNDSASNWCEAISSYYSSPGQYGTPGTINDCFIGP
ncbi:MAG: lamin tail domain-containing protein, partial [Oligoflexia bacterium]|nr:lamin tail domain-containing protein [Oligoflexia bacterium]